MPTIHPSLDAFSRSPGNALKGGPVAMVVAEDGTEIATTIAHLLGLGFDRLVLVIPGDIALPDAFDAVVMDRIEVVRHGTRHPGTAAAAVNALIDKVPGQWIHYCYNGEYLFFPFCESRSIGEVTAYVEEERRAAILTYVIDLYAADLSADPNGVSLENAHIDRAGYYAETRRDAEGDVQERQLNFYGGLRWRFEEHIPRGKGKIDRIGLFRAEPGLRLRPNHTLTDPERNTYACPWHHSLTATICSFRVAKALRTNPGSRHDVPSFLWHQSERFRWNSQQLMDLGLMEPGQWF